MPREAQVEDGEAGDQVAYRDALQHAEEANPREVGKATVIEEAEQIEQGGAAQRAPVRGRFAVLFQDLAHGKQR